MSHNQTRKYSVLSPQYKNVLISLFSKFNYKTQDVFYYYFLADVNAFPAAFWKLRTHASYFISIKKKKTKASKWFLVKHFIFSVKSEPLFPV